jgi:transposase
VADERVSPDGEPGGAGEPGALGESGEVDEPGAPGESGETGIDWDELLARLAGEPTEAGWVTLDEAARAAAVSRSALRSWYRSGRIPSVMVAGPHGPQRLVPLEAVLDRALASPRIRRRLDEARSLRAEVDDLRRRVEALEARLGLGRA